VRGEGQEVRGVGTARATRCNTNALRGAYAAPANYDNRAAGVKM
jgi:hypothetical protein